MQEKHSQIIINFLKSHPLISVLGLEKELKLPSGTLQHPMAGLRKIPEKHIYSIICYLAAYGLKIDGYENQLSKRRNKQGRKNGEVLTRTNKKVFNIFGN